jgi:hypothetical protein
MNCAAQRCPENEKDGEVRNLKLRTIIGVSDLRAEPKFRSERVSQTIFGEAVDVLKGGSGDYMHVRAADGYEAYTSRNGFGKVSAEPEYKIVQAWKTGDIRLPVGSLLTEDDVEKMLIPRKFYRPLDYSVDVLGLARGYLGVPYLWGGVSEFGIDCSGLVQRVFGFNGVKLPRNAGEQEHAGKIVSSLDEAEPEDTVFFPGHVGIYMGKGRLIHANLHNQRVSITDLSDRSAYSSYLRKHVTSIRRIRN